ncbi:5-oxoprolinase subunit B family protein [Actinomycetospora termitidis]|uniref:Allophanate hydrolase subunit 1 n=1 Tax=Actinomycetospora termitidis TaxID=3053470 RepID=A0ABT7M6X3_9PSEU|nr:allophanate hydrolase subunit 1 [Actinomycetospora sp. Odt1-22]MDL5156395.1 allophanate hydrolase subunit 1 [Actinomycetospora sp. Odt1-22]
MRTVRPCGDTGLLVELDSLDDVLALHATLAADPPSGTVDLVPAARTVLVRVASAADLPGVAADVRSREAGEVADRSGSGTVEIAVTYDGEDLDDVAEHTGLSRDDVVAAHTDQLWTVAFAGFTPGFGYLVGSDERLHVPRRASSRTRVPAGAVGLAGEFSGVYPRESPGGWQLIGRTDHVLWDLDRDPPAVLLPGTRIRFCVA